MTRSRSKLGRFVDNMRRNVLSYKYLKHNIMMTALVAVIAVCVFAVISFGENADPLADELYANDSVTVAKSEAVMMASGSVEMAVDAAVPADSYVSANNTARVASSAAGNDTVKTTETVTTETATEVTTEDPQVMNGVTASVLYDGVDVVSSEAADASYVATVNSGEVFDVVSQDESWIGVQLYDGSIGYISTEYVSVDASLQ
jgi:hypothetical protein